MSIRNRLLLLLLAIALTPLIVTSLLQQISIRVARDRLATRTREALHDNARQALQEQLRSHVEILERERQLADALLARQAREVELRLAELTPPAPQEQTGRFADVNMADLGRAMLRGRGGEGSQLPTRSEPGRRGGPGPFGVEIVSADYHFGADPNLDVEPAQRHAYFQGPAEPNAPAAEPDYQAQTCLVLPHDGNDLVEQARQELATMTPVYHEICAYQPSGILWLHTYLDVGLATTYPGGVPPEQMSRYDPFRSEWYRRAESWAGASAPRTGFGERGSGPDGGPPRDMSQRGGSRRDDGRAQDAGNRRAGGFDRGRRGWLRDFARIRIEAQQGAPSVDPFTNQPVVVRAVPVRYADGSFAGATAVVRTIPEIFASMQLPERWGTDIERMLVMVDPNVPVGRRTQILLHDGLGEDDTSRVRRLRSFREELRSEDAETLQTAIDEIAQGQAGVRVMEYRGRDCLWAYQPLDIPQVAAFLIVPQERVVELARTMEQSLLKESIFWLQGTTMVLLVAAIVAVVLAALKARDVTNPINALIEAGRALGGGNYDAQVAIQTGDEFEQLGRVFNETGPKLREREKLKRSLELAAAIQQSLLPRAAPSLNHFDISGRCLYCDETGGDYYDFIDLSTATESKATLDRVGLAVGDVSGHGISAALLMAATRGMIHAEAGYQAANLSGLFQALNTRLVAETVADRFVTLFYGLLDDRARTLVWASAGHEPALWYHAETGQIEALPNTGMPLGVVADTTFAQSGPIALRPDDVLVVGTDGIHEAQDPQGEFFGEDRFLEAIRANAGRSADAICQAVIEGVSQFVRGAPRTDDITLIVVKAKQY